MKAVVFALLAGLCWGIGELFTKSVLHTGKIGPITAIAVRSTVALPVLWLAYYLVVHINRAEPREWIRVETPVLLKLILGSGLVAGALGMIFFYSAISLGEVSKVKPIAFTVAPATAVMLGMIVLQEEITWQKMLAVCLVLAGVVLFTAR
ncbi:MAG TPA: DMT family transporter [Phycisphaerales bacterium]|nr:DMT family transporter [Phycisphaerales bacterium]HRQ75677.1 DMT family transporter [Phycisphaerales bacterium]